MQKDLEKLIDAERKAAYLFKQIELLNIIQPEKTEKDINNSIYELAFNLFGIKKYWHKRIVRAGKNTLYPYDENPENLMVKKNDIVITSAFTYFATIEAIHNIGAVPYLTDISPETLQIDFQNINKKVLN